MQADSQQSCADESGAEVYLNRADVKAALHVPSDIKFESCRSVALLLFINKYISILFSDLVASYYIIEYEDMGPFVKDIVVGSTRRSLFFNGDVDTVCQYLHNQQVRSLLKFKFILTSF